jgi:hypothetical protein
MKILSVGVCCFMQSDGWTDRQTDRETDMTKLIDALRSYVNAPEQGTIHKFHLYGSKKVVPFLRIKISLTNVIFPTYLGYS